MLPGGALDQTPFLCRRRNCGPSSVLAGWANCSDVVLWCSLFQPDAFEQFGDFRCKLHARLILVPYHLAQDGADFLLHRAALTRRAALKVALDRARWAASPELSRHR